MKTQLYTQLRSVARAKYSSPSTGILGTHNVTSSQLADSSVENCTGIAEVMGSNPVQA